MTEATFFSIVRYVAWRNLHLLFRTPAVLVPTLLFPLFFLIAFIGALSSLTEIPDFGSTDYTAFQYVFALMQMASFTGAMGGFSMADDFDSGFMARLMLTAPNRVAIVMGYLVAMLVRGILAAVVLTGVGFAFGMKVVGGPLDLVGLFGLAALLNIAATLWAAGVVMRVKSFKAAPGMVLPIFILLFLAPVFVPLALLHGWLHAVATVNPLTYLLEAGRGFIAGDPIYVYAAFGAVVGMVVLFAVWALTGVRKAERTGV